MGVEGLEVKEGGHMGRVASRNWGKGRGVGEHEQGKRRGNNFLSSGWIFLLNRLST